MRTVITYGTFDLLHRGHVRLLERAKQLGDRLIVGVTSDQFDRSRGKLNVAQTTLERVDAVRATGIADLVIIEEYEGQKIEDVRRYNVDIFTVGSDWGGHFDYLNELCEVVYLPRTKGISSTEIRSKGKKLRMGMVGDVPYLVKFLNESRYVEGIEVCALCAEVAGPLPDTLMGLPMITNSFEKLLDSVDAVFIISHPTKHYEQILKALRSGVHVLCESPIALREGQVDELFELSERTGSVLVESLRTAYSPAFHHLLLLVESGAIGKVVSVDATCTSLRPVDLGDLLTVNTEWNSICSWGPTAMLPVFQLLGTNYERKRIVSMIMDENTMFDAFSQISFMYIDSVATVKVGRLVKSEGELVVSGTEGYLYVPAPWWKTDYFEIRYEDQTRNKRYFWQLDGEGIRDELSSFVRQIHGFDESGRIDKSISKTIASVLEDYYAKNELVRLKRTNRSQ